MLRWKGNNMVYGFGYGKMMAIYDVQIRLDVVHLNKSQ